MFPKLDVALFYIHPLTSKRFYPPLGLLYVGTVLENDDFAVRIFDNIFTELNEATLWRIIKESSPHIVGFSLYLDNFDQIRRLSQYLKDINDDIILLAGGPYTTTNDQYILTNSCCDIVIRGEGELTARELVNYYLRGKGCLRKIQGITYKTNEGIQRNPSRLPLSNLDSIPFPNFGLLVNKKNYLPAVITSRGCVYHCSFCFEGQLNDIYRARSPENVLKEIDELINTNKVLYFTFADDLFTYQPRRVSKICQGLKERVKNNTNGFGWFCEGRADILANNPGMIQTLVNGGMKRIQIGIESGDNKILKWYQKNITLDQVTSVIKQCVKDDVPSIYGSFIIGGPFESKGSVMRTIAFAKKMIHLAPGKFECGASYLTLYPGTEISLDPQKFGLVVLDKETKTTFSLEYPTTETVYLKKSDILQCHDIFSCEIKKAMELEIKNLSRDSIDTVIHLYHTFGLTTQWAELLFSRSEIARYYEAYYRDIYTQFPHITTSDYCKWAPLRTLPPSWSKGGKIMINTIKNKLILGGIEANLYELSSGKLSIDDIMQICKDKIKNMSTSKEYLEQLIYSFYTKMDNNFLMIFRRW